MDEPARKREATAIIDDQQRKNPSLEYDIPKISYNTCDIEKLRDTKYQRMLNCEFILEASGIFKVNSINLPELKDIYMDHYYSSFPEDCAIATSGVQTCFAVAALATNLHGQKVLALAHLTSLAEGLIKEIFEGIIKDLERKNCLKEHIIFYVVGGAETTYMQNEFLDISEEFNIGGMLFNPLGIESEDDERSITVILTHNKLYYGEELLFVAAQGPNNMGMPLSEILDS